MDADDDLRRRAAATLGMTPGETEAEALVQSLRMHEAELLLQNEDLRRVQDELEASRRRYAALFDLAPLPYLRLDAAGRVREVNRAAAALFGDEPAALVGRGLLGHLPEDQHAIYEPHRQRAAAGAFDVCELRIQRVDGALRDVQLVSSPSPEDGGTLMAISDLTERTRQAQRLRAVLDSVPDGMVVVREDGVVESFSPAAEKIFGCPAAEVVGRPATRLLAARDHAAHADLLHADADAAHTPSRRELVAVRRDGVEFPAEATARVFAAPEPRLLLTIRDLTEAKHAADIARRAERLEAVAALATGVAHDFNNLLAGIRGCASAALKAVRSSPGAQEPLKAIERATLEGAVITRQLMAFARNTEAAGSEHVEIDVLVAENVELVRRLVGDAIEVHVDLGAPGCRPSCASADIARVLLNLAANARDAMPDGGRLTIGTSCATVDERRARALGLRRPGRHMVLEVGDTGVGMDEQTLARVFEPFFTTRKATGGTGLGLPMVHGMVRRAGGAVEVDSAPGAGTRFRLHLPASRPARTEEPAPSQPSQGHGETVLLVEDVALVRRAVRAHLEELGYRVVEAQDGAQALAQSERTPLHLVLTDVSLPGMGGAQVATRLAETHPGLPVVFMSGHLPSSVARDDRGINGPVLQKPFTSQELAAFVRAGLDGRPFPAIR